MFAASFGDGFQLRCQSQLGDRTHRMKRHRISPGIDRQIGQQLIVYELDRIQELHLVEALPVLLGQISTRSSEPVSTRTGIDYDRQTSLLRPLPATFDRGVYRDLV